MQTLSHCSMVPFFHGFIVRLLKLISADGHRRSKQDERSPRSQQLPEDAPSEALTDFQEQSWRKMSHLPNIESISYKQHFMRSHDAFTSLAIRPFSISVSSINLDIHLDITTKQIGIDHFFENSIAPLRRSRKAGSSNNVY